MTYTHLLPTRTVEITAAYRLQLSLLFKLNTLTIINKPKYD